MRRVCPRLLLGCAILGAAGLPVSCSRPSSKAPSSPAAAPAREDTAELIAALKAARDEDAKLAAVRKLMTREGNEVAEALQGAVDQEKEEEVKSRMVQEIAKGAAPEIIELLTRIYLKGDDGLFTGPAAEALVKIPGEKMTKTLVDGFKKQYTECAAARVADALQQRKDKEITDALLWAVDEMEPQWLTARAHVLTALGGRNEERVTKALLENLETAENEGMREAAARALALEGGAEVTAALIKALQTGDDHATREAAAHSLGKRGPSRKGDERQTIQAALQKALAEEKKDRVRKAITGVLAELEQAKAAR